jgi:hypothetical protein
MVLQKGALGAPRIVGVGDRVPPGCAQGRAWVLIWAWAHENKAACRIRGWVNSNTVHTCLFLAEWEVLWACG